ncbi:MAG: ABC transporter permease subunit, partial [Anaerolineales bacterium]
MKAALPQARPKVRSPELGLRAASFTFILLMVLIPLAVIIQDGLKEGLGEFWRQVTLPVAAHAILLTLWTSALMTIINAAMGLLTAFVLVRYDFPGKALLNAIVDLPLAIPTLVTGVMLVILYGPQQALGQFLNQELGFQIIFAPPGIVLALLFITFPFVVRSIQPVLLELDRQQEHAAATLGARSWT